MVLWFCTFDFSFSFLFIIYLSKALHSCAKEHSANAESSFRKENACFKVFLSWWKRSLLHWQRLSAGKLCLCKELAGAPEPPVLSFPPPQHPLLGWSSCLQAAWWERSRNSSVLEKVRRGNYFWPGSVLWSSLPSRPASGWSSPAEGAVVKQKSQLQSQFAWEKQSIFTDCRLNKELQGWLLGQRFILCCAGSHKL